MGRKNIPIPAPEDLRTMEWPEANAAIGERSVYTDKTDPKYSFDWGSIPIENTGRGMGGAALVSAVMERCPEPIQTVWRDTLRWEFLEQKDVNAHKLMAGVYHPAQVIEKTCKKIEERWTWSKGHILVLPPAKLFGGRMMLRFSKIESVNCMVGTLPPIECIGILYSKGLRPEDDASSLVVLWYQTGFGIDVDVIEKVKQIDWSSRAYSYGY